MIVHWVVTGVSGSEATGYQSALATNRYRCILPARGLRALGHVTRLIDMATWDPQFHEGVDRPDAVVIGKLLPGNGFDQLRSHLHAGIEAARHQGIKIVSDINDDHFKHPQLGPHLQALVQSSDAVVAGSEAMAEVVREHGGKRVYVIGDPVAAPSGEASMFHPAKGWHRALVGILSLLGSPAPRLRLVWYGNPTNWPGMAAWVPQLMALAKEQPWLLTVVSRPGAGIEQFIDGFNAASHRSAQIVFEPWSEQGQWDAIADAHLVLLPADLADPRATVKTANRLVDALQSGRFAIAAPVPAYRALAEYAWLGEAPAAGILWALANPEQVVDKLRRGQKYVQAHHSLDAIARRWAEVLSDCVASAGLPTASARSDPGSDLASPGAKGMPRGHDPNNSPDGRTSRQPTAGLRLNLGCGDKLLPGYLNIDVAAARAGKRPDLICDLRQLCLAEAVAVEVMAIHVIEHFWRWEVDAVLREWLRVLAPGGKLVIECPNLVSACQALLADPDQAAEQDSRGRMSMWVFYGDPAWRDPLMTHRWAYTHQSLSKLLQSVGYVNVRQEPAQFKMREPRDMRVVGEKPVQ